MNRFLMVVAVGFSSLALAVGVWTAVGSVQGVAGAPSPPSSDPGVAVVVGGGCNAGRVKFKTSTSFISTTSSSFVNVLDMDINFVVSGSVPTCVVVEFSAAVSTAAGEIMEVRAILDGAPGLPVDVWGFAGGNTWGAHAFNFAFKDVAPGAHTVKIQYKSESGVIVFMYRRSLVVRYQ